MAALLRAGGLSSRRRRVLIAEILDDDGRPMCRIWDDPPPPKTPPRSIRSDYGPTWPASRAAALLRDGFRCVRCGDDFDLHVHHVRPLRLFNGDTETANQLNNLETLCQPCHVSIHVQLRAEV